MVPALQRYHRAPGFLRRNLPAQPPATLTLGNGREHTAETIFALWARGKSEHTVRAYQQDVADFALYFSRALHISPPLSTAAAMDRLFKQSAPSAHEIVFLFREYLTASGLAPASVNRHLATLRSLSKLGRMLGAVAWQLEVPGVRSRKSVGARLDQRST
ncbi:MAG: site-specific integrase [Vicinamibacterales bacterium]